MSCFTKHPVRYQATDDGQHVYVCLPHEAQAWGVYEQDMVGREQWITDCLTELDAAALILWIQLRDRRQTRSLPP